jgi:hypothetical protein
MSIIEKRDLPDGYSIEFHQDEDAGNPLKEFDCEPTLVLHERAEQHFGWTTDEDWGRKLNGALDRVRVRHDKAASLALIARWLRVFHDVPVALPVGAGEHSGTWVYLGSGSDQFDPQGWDSGWIGWFFVTGKELVEDWGHKPEDLTTERVTELLEGSFGTFKAYVAGEVYGWVALDPEGDTIQSCWGFYGDDEIEEDGYAYGEALDAVMGERGRRAGIAAKAAQEAAEDEAEIADLVLAEIGLVSA